MDPLVAQKDAASADIVRTRGQRRINILWESTQSIIALAVTGSTLWVAAQATLHGTLDTAGFQLLGNSFFLVVGFYFGRTNHERTGGVQDRR